MLAVVCCVFALTARAQQNYDASLISKNLLPYASAVVRYCDEGVEVKDLGYNLYHIKKAITVLNKNGDAHASIFIVYDKMSSIRGVKGTLYDAFGKPIGKFSERNFEDFSAASQGTLFADDRVKYFSPAVVDYPYTVEYEYETKSRQTMYFADWAPSAAPGVAVEKSTYTFTCRPDFAIRYKECNLTTRVSESTAPKTGLKTYTWSVGPLKALRNEPFSPDDENYLPVVKIAPEKFMYDGVSGSFTNWNEMGKWMNDKLLAGKDALTPATVERVKEITAGITNPKEKARKIYEFMQQKCRYISVQVGIGGIRPFPATDVDQLNYGDCKGLVNYTKALLKAAGIDAYYCIVYSGNRKRSFIPDFPSMQGDHVILCVPFKNDTTWLECTSQKMPFGFLGDFTDDRIVMACTPDGGKLMHTPKYSGLANLTKRQGKFTINADGELSGEMNTVFNGTEFDERYPLIDEPYKEQLKGIQQVYSINNLDIQKMAFVKNKSALPATTEEISLKARDYAVTNAGKFYFTVNLANRFRGKSVPNEVRNRVTDFYINRGYIDDDEFTYTLPEGYKNDKLLLNKTINKPFGSFSVSTRFNGHELVYHRVLKLNDGTFNKDMYQDFVDFFQSVADADSYTATFVKN